MFQMHVTKDGEQMLVGQMTDKHLVNTINLICQELAEQTIILVGTPHMEVDPVTAALMPQSNPEHQKEVAKREVIALYNKLQPYVFEASLRNIDVSEELQNALQRKGRIGGRTRRQRRFLDGERES